MSTRDDRESDQQVRYVSRARLSARVRTLLHKTDRTDAENAEMQQLLMDHMQQLREADDRARRRRARRDELLAPLAHAWGRVLWPVCALWNTLVLIVHDLLIALGGRLRRLAARICRGSDER